MSLVLLVKKISANEAKRRSRERMTRNHLGKQEDETEDYERIDA